MIVNVLSIYILGYEAINKKQDIINKKYYSKVIYEIIYKNKYFELFSKDYNISIIFCY